jgi:uncharacterized membrane protein YdjX (TVP38/TMEM64 family)
VFFSRLFPVVSFDIISYGAGLTKMSLGNFSVATFLGMLPLTFIYNTFGSVLFPPIPPKPPEKKGSEGSKGESRSKQAK